MRCQNGQNYGITSGLASAGTHSTGNLGAAEFTQERQEKSTLGFRNKSPSAALSKLRFVKPLDVYD